MIGQTGAYDVVTLETAEKADFAENGFILPMTDFFADKKEIDPAVAAHNREVGRIIVKALGRLEDKQRAAVVLRDIEGMAYAEIAESLNVEIGTVKSRISRGRESLREILKATLKV